MKCDICQTHRSSNQKEPMLSQEIPENPWQTVGTDLFSWNSWNSSQEFRRFAEYWGFQHITSSPRYPQSNDLAEKTVQTAKRILTKAKQDKMDPYLSLLEYRNTPVDGLKSPAQILMSRRLRSILPSTTAQLRPQVTPQSLVQERREECQLRQKRHYDTSARPLLTPQAGALIHYQQEDGTWQPATIVKPAETPRSYHIKTGDDHTPPQDTKRQH
uniref:Integrase catalytic domain-containing protein n=1 Tax=Neolamprologus brichardi TaxID=32507 RepID=A0A3Q4MZZ0_NEOBR